MKYIMIYLCYRRKSYYIFEDYAKSIEQQQDSVSIISCDFLKKAKLDPNDDFYLPNGVKLSKEDVLIFIRTIPKGLDGILHGRKHYLLNTEQLARTSMKQDIIKCLKPNTRILDYSLANIECMKKHATLSKRHIGYLPYQINPKEIYNYPKIHNVCMIGNTSPRRNPIMNAICQLPDSHVVTGFGYSRDNMVFRHKILVNIHFDENYQIFEQIRCNRCVFNKMIVITEQSHDDTMNQKHELAEYIISVPYSEIMSKVTEVLANYDFYYRKLFDNFDINFLKTKYKLLDEILK